MIDSYDKLTLGKWLELKDVDTNQEEIDIQADILSILSDMTVDELLNLPIQEYNQMVRDSMFLTKEPQTLNKLPNKFKIGDKEFTILTKPEDMTAGQYIDYQSYIKNDDIAHILTCFVIPVGEKYGESNTEELAQLFKDNMPVTLALSIARFFFQLFLSLIRVTVDYLISKTKKTARKMKNKEMLKALKAL